MHYGKKSALSLLLITLCLTEPLRAASNSWTDTVLGLASQAWQALPSLPSREQVVKTVNPFNWNMTPEQQRNLLLIGTVSALGAGAYTYNRYGTSEKSPVNNDEEEAKNLIRLFYKERSDFTKSDSNLDKINIFKSIWLIQKQLIHILKTQKTSNAFAENTLKTSLTIINNFLLNNIIHLDITVPGAYTELLILDPLDTNDIIDQTFIEKTNNIQSLLQKKKNAAKYYSSIQRNRNPKNLKENIKNSELVLDSDIPILTSSYLNQFEQKHFPLAQSGASSPHVLTAVPLVDTPSHSTETEYKDISSPTPNLSAFNTAATVQPSVSSTPKHAEQEQREQEKESSVNTSLNFDKDFTGTINKPRSEELAAFEKINVLADNALSQITQLKESLTGRSIDLETASEIDRTLESKTRTALLATELKTIRNNISIDKLKEFSKKVADEELLDADRKTLELEIKNIRKSLTANITQAASKFKQQPTTTSTETAVTPTASAEASAPSTTEIPTITEPIIAPLKPTTHARDINTKEVPSLAGATKPLSMVDDLIAEIHKATSFEMLENIQNRFDTYNITDQANRQRFEIALDTKYNELVAKEFSPRPSPATIARLDQPIKTKPETAARLQSGTRKPFSTEELPVIPTKKIEPAKSVSSNLPIATQKRKSKEEEKEEEEKPIRAIPNLQVKIARPFASATPPLSTSQSQDAMDLFLKGELPKTASPLAEPTPIIIKNNTSTSIELKGSYRTVNGTIKEIKEPIFIEKNGFVDLPDAQNLNLQYYQPGGWFSYYITENIDYGPNTITLQDSNLGGYTYTITNQIKDDPYTLLKVDPTASYEEIQHALQKPGINPSHLKAASYYTLAGLSKVGEIIYDILSKSPVMPIIKDKKGTIISIGDPDIIWKDLEDLTADLQDKLNLGQHALHEYMRKALVVYFYDLAHKRGHELDEGTIIPHDDPKQNELHPAGAIFTFLASMEPELRYASHFNGLARLDPEKYAQLATTSKNFYELKVDLTKESKLWGDEEAKTVILFNWLTAQKIPVGNEIHYIPTSMFIKPERNGTQGWAEWLLHAGDYIRTQWTKWNGSDVDDQPKYSKERVPVALLKEYEILVNATVKNITPETINDLVQNNPQYFSHQLNTWHPEIASSNADLLADLSRKNKPLSKQQQLTLTTFKAALRNTLSAPAIKKMLLRYNTRDGWGIQKMIQLTDTANPPLEISDNDYGPSINKGDDLIITFAPRDAMDRFKSTLNRLKDTDPEHNDNETVRYGREFIKIPSVPAGNKSSGSSSSSNQP